MATQTFTFVVLPNGFAASGALRLSVYLTPRLDGAPTLAGFPDLLHWATRVKNLGLSFQISSNSGGVATAKVNTMVLRPDIWDAVFTKDVPVSPFQNPAFERKLFVSYPARDVMAFMKYAYQYMGATALGTIEDRRAPLDELLGDLVFRQGPSSNLSSALSNLRVTLWDEQEGKDSGSGSAGPPVMVRAHPRDLTALGTPALPPDGIPTVGSEPAGMRDAAMRFALFHHMPAADGRPDLPNTAADWAKLVDFHKALTMVASYPALLRALGLVFDLELPKGSLGDSPTGSSYATLSVSAVTPGFPWQIEPTLVTPATAYLKSSGQFQAAPSTPPSSAASQSYQGGDVFNGFLVLSPEAFHLTQVDLDGGMLAALSLADANAFAGFNGTPVEQVLPALRSSGIALMATARAETLLAAVKANQAFNDSLTGNGAMPRPFQATDLIRGYRLDIWSSQDNTWHSLHRRNSTYTFGAHADPVLHIEDEEGFTQLATAQPADDPTRKTDPVATAAGIPQPGTDLYLHERVAGWSGWSLSVQRPGGALNRSPDPDQATDADPTVNQPLTPFKMKSTFGPVDGSLPRLRFGARYRLRARTVDLAGNSVPLHSAEPAGSSLPSGTDLPYLRFEPVPTPVVLLRKPTQQGASLDQMVIRSFNSNPTLDRTPTAANDERHVYPPRAAVRMVEHHGLLDTTGPHASLKGDGATYSMLTTRDAAELSSSGGVPMEAAAQGTVNYLPDPIARGAAFRTLPNTRYNTEGDASATGLAYTTPPQVETRPGSVTHVSFGDSWPGLLTFRIVLQEGSKAPVWDNAQRVLTVSLRKAQQQSVQLSSYLNAGDLSLMGVWDWLRQYLEYAEFASASNESGPVFPSNLMALLTQLTLEGGHPMITPARTLTMVHATQQPLGVPEFTVLPVVRPSGQSSAVVNAFVPLSAWRSPESHSALLLGGLKIHGASTSRVDIQARWIEFSDDPSSPEPEQLKASAHVDTITLGDLGGGKLYADASESRAVATYIPQGDVLWFSAPGDSLPGLSSADLAAPLHTFEDTKHRRVRYKAISTSAFQEYFPQDTGLVFTRTSAEVLVNVPSSARPASPDVRYVLPVFGTEQQEGTNIRTVVRQGNGVRVYLGRSWYSSGESELLGVVLWGSQQTTNLTTALREKYKSYFTQWGMDPIWKTDSLEETPDTGSFPIAVQRAQNLTLDRTDLTVDVAGHCVFYDAGRQLWYSDIVFENPWAYTPFVRMALARYQPHSLPGVELSAVVLADFVQLSPDRSAVLSIDPANPSSARVFVGGLLPEGPQQSRFTVTVERRMANVVTDLGWEIAPTNVVTVIEDPPASSSVELSLWSGTITFAKQPPVDQFRVVVREFELLKVDPTVSVEKIFFQQYGERLVYAAIIPFAFPQ